MNQVLWAQLSISDRGRIWTAAGAHVLWALGSDVGGGTKRVLRATSALRAPTTAAALALFAIAAARVGYTDNLPPSLDDTLIEKLGLGVQEGPDPDACAALITFDANQNLTVGEDAYTEELVKQLRHHDLTPELAAICDNSTQVGTSSSTSAPMGGSQATKNTTQFNFMRRRVEVRLRPRSSLDSGEVKVASLDANSPLLGTATEAGLGWAFFGKVEHEHSDRTQTHYEGGYKANSDSGLVGFDYAWPNTVLGFWGGYSNTDADLRSGGVFHGDTTADEQKDADAILRSVDKIASLCGVLPGEGEFADRGPRFGAYLGTRLGDSGYIDVEGNVAAQRYSYDRSVCAIEFPTGGRLDVRGGHLVLLSDLSTNAQVLEVADDIFAGDVSGKTWVREYGLAMNVGAHWSVGALVVSPQASLNYRREETDAFQESGRSSIENVLMSEHLTVGNANGICPAGTVPPTPTNLGDPECFAVFDHNTPTGLEIAYDDQAHDSLRSEIGADIAVPIETAFGAVVPHVGAKWRHEFNDGRDTVTFHMAGDRRPVPTTLSFVTDAPDTDDAVFTAGVAVQVGDNVVADVQVSHVAFNDLVESTAVTAQVRWRF